MSTQFPSLEGNEELEVEQRSADGSDGLVYKKTFNAQGDFSDTDSETHDANKLATLQEALNRGLHPKEEPTLLSDELHSVNRRGVETRSLTYGVEVEPAAIDVNHPEGTVEPSELVQVQGERNAEARSATDETSPRETSAAPRSKNKKEA